MEQVKLTNNNYEVLNQDNFKNVSIYQVEKAQKEYAKYIRNCDYHKFILKLITIKLNKDGSIPHNINRALAIKGGTFDEKFWKEYGRICYLYTSKDKKNYKFYLSYIQSYSSTYIEVVCDPLNANGYTSYNSVGLSIYFDKEKLNSLEDFEKVCQKELERQEEYQKGYISQLKNISKVAKQLEKINYFDIYKCQAREWIS